MTAILGKELHGKKINFDEIPILDLKVLNQGGDITELAKELRHVLSNIGFLYVKNHGVEQSILDGMEEISKKFFALSAQEKASVHVKKSNMTLRGYIGLFEENVDPENTRDYKECYDFGAETPPDTPFFGSNPFPNTYLPEFGETVTKYHDAMLNLGLQLSRAIAVSLNLQEDFFEDRLSKPITIQRILRYPSQEGKIDKKEMGIGAHTDYGFLTILRQDNTGGLQVQNHQGEWISAPPIENTFIINVGDLLQTLTGGIYVSTMHRVINTSGKERFSYPFFMDMNFDALVEVVPTCKDIATENVEPYRCGHHKFTRFADSYAHLNTINVEEVLKKL